MDSRYIGMDMATPAFYPQPSPTAASGLPSVQIEVRGGSARATHYELSGEEFLIGSVPGCDLRLPGTNLPPVVCLIARQTDGVRLRKLAPTLPVLLNGQPIAQTSPVPLNDGDRISIGAVDLRVAIQAITAAALTVLPSISPLTRPDTEEYGRRQDRDQQARDLEARERALQEATHELEADRVLWYRRREEMEAELRQTRSLLERNDRAAGEITAAEIRLQRQEEELLRREAELQRQLAGMKNQRGEVLSNRAPGESNSATFGNSSEPGLQALREQIEREVIAQHRHRAEELDRFQIALREAAVQHREKKQALDEQAQKVEALNSQYQADLARVDRRQAQLEQKERQLQSRAMEIDHRFEQFQRDSRDLEAQVLEIDHRQEQLRAEDLRQTKQRLELDQREGKINERAAQIEGQQVTLAALRTRLERMREEVHQDATKLAGERARLEDQSREAQEKLVEAERLREQMAHEQQGQSDTQRVFTERSAILQQAVARMKELQGQLTAEDERLRTLGEELSAKAIELAEREGLVAARTEQLREQQDRLENDRTALRDREALLSMTDGARGTLQDQLQRRSEELSQRQRDLDQRASDLSKQADLFAEETEKLELLRGDAERRSAAVALLEAEIRHRAEQLEAAQAQVVQDRQALEESRRLWEENQTRTLEQSRLSQAEVETGRQSLERSKELLLQQVPELEQRTQAALERTLQARELLRGQLAELHGYARQSHEDLDRIRAQVQGEMERLRNQETALARSRSEHRLAVTSFRQQLIEWQSRFAQMKQALTHGETRLERREKEVEATSLTLARKVEAIQVQEQVVAEKRDEMDRHLTDMRDWYRKKIRELLESRGVASGTRIVTADDEAPTLPMPAIPLATDAQTSEDGVIDAEPGSTILSLADDLDPADRKLGELLRSLELVDHDTLMGLWSESRRQRRPLRQVLLSGGFLTLYQLALIESDNLNGLVLGRFRVVDRLHSSSRETIYRVFDPRLSSAALRSTRPAEDGICVLRYLGESEMQDALHPDEYRQRFAAVRDLAHPNIASTWELLEIQGRPAIVQEALRGLSGSEFPAQVGNPSVWYRLMSQAALALHTAHHAGMIHGQLTADSFVLTREGVLKIVGLGEPPWLSSPANSAASGSAEDDLRALGQVAFGWMQAAPKRKGKKPFPERLQAILSGLGAESSDGVPTALYPSVSALLEDLEQAGPDIPADSGAWEKLLQFVVANANETPVLRLSA